MKTKINHLLFCMLALVQSAIAQTNSSSGTNYDSVTIVSDSIPCGNIKSTNDLAFQNVLLNMELEGLKEAYNSLEQKFEKKNLEIELYQKLIHQNTIIPSNETFSCINVKNARINCGEAFLEPISPNIYSENSVITYFISDGFKESMVCIFNGNNIEILDFKIEEPGYGQVTINSDILKYGTYNCCLLTDGRKMDCKKMILLK